ncbi:hypothetical protein PSI15_03565 [Xenorhabdus sp. PR6a]|uniref:hypothetical protein n=1 Tax=Xenorhabdus sp. PR6a TaxID=3025877 RepID=UPI002359DAC8|nr:hypothetical protein [Xenorhabdus sp. PR6a]MDC9580655.1 hypothetical protein [Xenorhabdus sp. PR6a]
MIYRTKSFSINNHNDFLSKSLRQTKSTLDMRLIDAELRDLRDPRRFIHIKKGNAQEASYAVGAILRRMDEEQLAYDFFKDNWENEKKKRNTGEASGFGKPNLSNILKSHGLMSEQRKNVLTEIEIETKEEIKRNFCRYQNSKTIFKFIKQSINYFDDKDKFFIAYYFTHPIGILHFSTKKDIPTVVNFAMHYLIRNCGYLLMEFAVNESVDLGKEGRLQLEALSGAETAYFDMGFLKTNNDLMILEPAMNDKWCKINGHYKLQCINNKGK